MREIKFRVWDLAKKVFIPTEAWAVTTSNFSYFAVMVKDWEDYKEGEYMYPNTQTLSQFTGLKDKNGKEIYEGDHFGNKSFPVYFSDGCFVLGGIPLKGYLNGEYMNQASEIKGNIHQDSI